MYSYCYMVGAAELSGHVVRREVQSHGFQEIRTDYLGSCERDRDRFTGLIRHWYPDLSTQSRLIGETDSCMKDDDCIYKILVLRDELGKIQATCGYTTVIPEYPYRQMLLEAYGEEALNKAFMSTRLLTNPSLSSPLKALFVRKAIIAHLKKVHEEGLLYGVSSNPDELANARSIIKSLYWKDRGHQIVTHNIETSDGHTKYQQGYQIYTIYLNEPTMISLHQQEMRVDSRIQRMGIAMV